MLFRSRAYAVLDATTFMSLEDVIKSLQKNVVQDVLHIEVRRSSVMEDALRAASKRKFDPSKSLKVC